MKKWNKQISLFLSASLLGVYLFHVHLSSASEPRDVYARQQSHDDPWLDENGTCVFLLFYTAAPQTPIISFQIIYPDIIGRIFPFNKQINHSHYTTSFIYRRGPPL